MDEPGRPYTPELGDYLGAVRRRWWFVLAAVIVGLVLGGAYYKLAPKTFSASAAVYVTATGTSSNQLANGRTMHSSLTPRALVKQTSVTVPANSQVLVIACDAGSAKGAAACAQAFATAYLQYRSSTTSQGLKNQLTALQDRISSLQKDTAKLASAVASLPSNSPQSGADQALLGVDKAQLNQYSTQVVALSSEQADSSGGYIISNATVPGRATSPSKILALAGGFAAGLIVGLIGAFWWDRRDKRLRSAQDVTRLGLRVLPGPPLPARHAPELAIAPADSPAGKAFTGLAHMVAAAVPEGRSVILVTGTSSRPGASLVAANLAAGLARTHPPVALVCADLPGSVAPRVAGVAARPGLAELMAGRLDASEAAARGAVTNLSVVTPGVDGMADTAIQQDVMERLVGTLRPEARFVVIEAPPLAEAGDVYALAPLADATLIVAEVGHDARPELVSGVEQLEQLGTSVLGVVLVPTLRDDGQGTYAPGARARPATEATHLAAATAGNGQPGGERVGHLETTTSQATEPVTRG
jgi:Mrp family chromosome partitioning ATPase